MKPPQNETKMKNIKLQPILDEIRDTLSVVENVRVTTSGYTDRWLVQDLNYNVTVMGAPVTFRSSEALHSFVYNAIRTAHGNQFDFDEAACRLASDICRVKADRWETWGTWRTPRESQTSRINRNAVAAFLELKTNRLTPDAESQRRAEVLKLSEFDKEFLRHGLRDCNERNAELAAAGLRDGHETHVDATVD